MKTELLTKTPKLCKSIVFKDKSVDNKGKYVVFDYSTALGFLTNKQGIWIISKCDGENKIYSIIEQSYSEYPNTNRKKQEKDIVNFLKNLEKNKIIEIK